jgi:hypothetical protein
MRMPFCTLSRELDDVVRCRRSVSPLWRHVGVTSRFVDVERLMTMPSFVGTLVVSAAVLMGSSSAAELADEAANFVEVAGATVVVDP